MEVMDFWTWLSGASAVGCVALIGFVAWVQIIGPRR